MPEDPGKTTESSPVAGAGDDADALFAAFGLDPGEARAAPQQSRSTASGIDTGTDALMADFDATATSGSRPGEPVSTALEPAAGTATGLSVETAELLAMMSAEIQHLSEHVQTYTGAADRGHVAQLSDDLSRLCGATQAMGLTALAHSTERVAHAVAEWGHTPPEPAELLLQSWFAAVAHYLEHFPDAQACETLATLHAQPEWPSPMDPEEVQMFALLLAEPPSEPLPEDAPVARAQHAAEDDVSLAVPADVHEELLEAMLSELPSQTTELSGAVQALTDTFDMADLDVAQRLAHTLKGAANTVGVPGIANLTHHMEDILLAITRAGVRPPSALLATLVEATDCLEAMSEYLLGVAVEPQGTLEVLQQVLDWANRIDSEGLPADSEALSPGLDACAPAGEDPGGASVSISEDGSRPAQLQDAAARENGAAALPRSEPASAAQTNAQGMVRVPAQAIDNLLRLVGETIILTGQLREQLDDTRRQANAMRGQFNSLAQLGRELEQFIDLKDLNDLHARGEGQADFDPLEMDQYNELHTLSRRVVESATDAGELGRGLVDRIGALDEMLVSHDQLNAESQDAVLRTRMVPVRTLVARLTRTVRQTCRHLGKDVELRLSGEDTYVDSNLLAEIVDPLMHVLRNAVDHGMEPVETREQAGKRISGLIEMSFARDGRQLLVRCQDDGAGLDYDAIHAAAVRRGLLDAGQRIGRETLVQMILRPQFSTRTQVSHTSGRGIGLDAVHDRVVALGGSLRLESEPGHGCIIEMRLPLTLVSSHALIATAGDETVVFTNRGVEQILHSGDGEIGTLGSEQVYRFDGEVYPVKSLRALTGARPGAAHVEGRHGPVLIVLSESGRQAVLVDALLDSREVVVKDLGPHLPRLKGIIGATILGNGDVSPVLDLPDLLSAGPAQMAPLYGETEVAPGASGAQRMRALVVDDSLSARRALERTMADCGFEVLTARDGAEAVEILERETPCVVVTDLEMPRMNGIELVMHIRAKASTRAIPVVMVTSRSTAKHRQQANEVGVSTYITKPYSDDELMERVSELVAEPA